MKSNKLKQRMSEQFELKIMIVFMLQFLKKVETF